MVALVQGKAIKTRSGEQLSIGAAANAVIYAGAIVCVNASGWVVPGSTATGLRCVGYAEASVDNTGGANGAVLVPIRKELVLCVNSSAGDAITGADVNSVCYIVDDQTVAKTSGSSTRSVAGRVAEVGADGVWVALGEPATPTA